MVDFLLLVFFYINITVDAAHVHRCLYLTCLFFFSSSLKCFLSNSWNVDFSLDLSPLFFCGSRLKETGEHRLRDGPTEWKLRNIHMHNYLV